MRAPRTREREWTIDGQGGSRSAEATSNGNEYEPREPVKIEKKEPRHRE